MAAIARLAMGLLALLFVATSALPAGAQGLWTLKQIVVTNKLNQFAEIIHDVHDQNGGDVQISVRGEALGICPGGREVVRFRWRFADNPTRLSNGGAVGASIQGDVGVLNPPCGGAIAALSAIALHGTSGGVRPLPESVSSVIDFERFYTRAPTHGNYAWAGKEPRTNVTGVGVGTNPPIPGRNNAYLTFELGTRGGGQVYYSYLYEQGAGGGIPPTGGLPPGGGTTPGGNACGHTIGSGIFNKWTQFGGQRGGLGCARGDEAEAGRSPQGTSGRYAQFEGGFIVWHRDGALAGRAFEVHGCIAGLYQNMGGTGSWLGFPVSDEYDAPGGRRSDFQGGYIFWDARTRQCQAFRAGAAPPLGPPGPTHVGPPGSVSLEPDVNRRGGDYNNFALGQANPELCRSACTNDQRCRAFTYVAPGVQAPQAHCWLKSSVPPPAGDRCCVSGVKQ